MHHFSDRTIDNIDNIDNISGSGESRFEARLLWFGESAQELARIARLRGLVVPAFRSPPRRDRLTRSIRWGHDGTATVAIRVVGRPVASIQRDLIEGLLEANRLEGSARDAARESLLVELSGMSLAGQSGPKQNPCIAHDPAA
jgi:hypothetical protein